MSVKADWGMPVVERERRVDPFGDGPPPVRLDLTDPVERLTDLLRQEGQLADAGVECDLKWNGQACSTCPVSQRGAGTPMEQLCIVGLEQEQTVNAAQAPFRS